MTWHRRRRGARARDLCWKVRQRSIVGTCFEQQDPPIWILRQTRGKDRARRSSTDDDHVIGTVNCLHKAEDPFKQRDEEQPRGGLGAHFCRPTAQIRRPKESEKRTVHRGETPRVGVKKSGEDVEGRTTPCWRLSQVTSGASSAESRRRTGRALRQRDSRFLQGCGRSDLGR